MMNKKPWRAAVLGATGYTGQELVALLARHPRIRAAFVSSEAEAGQPSPGTALRYVRAEDVPLDEADVVFCCLPHGEAEAWALRARTAGARVVDLSSDLRDGRHGAVYGLTELNAGRGAERGAGGEPGLLSDGCAAGADAAACGRLWTGRGPTVVNAASGVTGAGRTAKRDLLFGEVAEDYRAYGVGNTHRHVPEIARGLAAAAGGRWTSSSRRTCCRCGAGSWRRCTCRCGPGVAAADVVGAGRRRTARRRSWRCGRRGCRICVRRFTATWWRWAQPM
jgi:N-acetyl-gamma-glutamyl-phosphate reductase